MSSPQPSRPQAPRRPGPPSATPATQVTAVGLTAEEIKALEGFADDGEDASLDPDNAGVGFLGTGNVPESAQIVSSEFKRSNYPDKPLQMQNVVLEIGYKRALTGKVTRTSYEYAGVNAFSQTSDGNKIKVRPEFMKKHGFAPKPKGHALYVLFSQTLKRLSPEIAAKLNAEGAKSLVGLNVTVQQLAIEGRTKKVLLPTSITGSSEVATTAPVNPNQASVGSTSPATVVETPALAQVNVAPVVDNAEVEILAEAAMIDILNLNGKTIARNLVPATLLRIESWKTHALRSEVLKKFREDAFITRVDAPWKLEGNTITLN